MEQRKPFASQGTVCCRRCSRGRRAGASADLAAPVDDHSTTEWGQWSTRHERRGRDDYAVDDDGWAARHGAGRAAPRHQSVRCTRAHGGCRARRAAPRGDGPAWTGRACDGWVGGKTSDGDSRPATAGRYGRWTTETQHRTQRGLVGHSFGATTFPRRHASHDEVVMRSMQGLSALWVYDPERVEGRSDDGQDHCVERRGNTVGAAQRAKVSTAQAGEGGGGTWSSGPARARCRS